MGAAGRGRARAATEKAWVSAAARSPWTLELAGDVGLRGAELARVPQHPADGVGGAQLDQRGVRGAGVRAVPGAQPHRQVAADEGAQRLREPLRDARPVAASAVRLSVMVISRSSVGEDELVDVDVARGEAGAGVLEVEVPHPHEDLVEAERRAPRRAPARNASSHCRSVSA